MCENKTWKQRGFCYLADQQPFAHGGVFGVRQQKACFVFPSVDHPLQSFAVLYIMAHHKGLNPRFFSIFHLVRMNDHISPTSPVQGMDRSSLVSVKAALWVARRQNVVD